MRESETITAPEQLTPHWFTEALRSSGDLTGGRVTRASIERIAEDQGFVGRLFRCKLEYDNRSEAPASLIVKTSTENAHRRRLFGEFGLYEREVRFYGELQPSVPLPTPRCYFAEYDEEDYSFLLLLEDLAPAIPGDPLAGCSVAEASTAVDLIARMHGALWQSSRLESASWLPVLGTEQLKQRVAASYDAAWSSFERQAGRHMSPSLIRLGRRLGAILPDALDRLSSEPRTLVHGDYQLGNIFYGEDGTVRALADWQVVVKGRGPLDVSHLLVRSLQPADRKANERVLLRRYHSSLLESGVDGYSFGECWDDYRLAALSQFGLGLVLAHEIGSTAAASSPETRLQSLSAVVGGRLMRALEELDPVTAIERPSLWKRAAKMLTAR